MGAMAFATVIGAQGTGLSVIVMDSGCTSPVIPQSAENRCLFLPPTEVDLMFNAKIGSYAQPEYIGNQAISRGQMLTPIFLLWDENDPTCDCDPPEITLRNNPGNPVTGTGCALMYRPLVNAIAGFNPMSASAARRACVQDRETLPGTCNLHSPAKVDS